MLNGSFVLGLCDIPSLLNPRRLNAILYFFVISAPSKFLSLSMLAILYDEQIFLAPPLNLSMLFGNC
jgi:hypothetical protein